MPRLTDGDVTRLLAGLGHAPAEYGAGAAPAEYGAGAAPAESHGRPAASDRPTRTDVSSSETAGDAVDVIAGLRARLADAAQGGALAQQLSDELHDYLRRPAACSMMAEMPKLGEAMRFEGGDPIEWHLDLATPVAAALGDLIIGGSGANTRHANRRKLGRLLEPLATMLVGAIADAAQAERTPMRFIEAPKRAAAPLAGGTIEAAAARDAWIAGAALRTSRATAFAPAAPVETIAAVTTPAARAYAAGATADARSNPPREIVHPVAESVGTASDVRQTAGTQGRERVIAARPADDGAFTGAVAAACARLGAIARCETTLGALAVTRVEAPVLTRGDLKLALIAGGQGSLVLSADPEAVNSVAAAAVGTQVAPGAHPGAVVVDAVETVLRAALREFADNLPGAAGGQQRFVRLAEGALPARSPHYRISAPLRIADRAATLHWLVPAWMAAGGSEERGPTDGH